METLLETLSKDERIALVKQQHVTISSLSEENTSLNANVTSLHEKVEYLKSQVEMYKRMQFGQKRERFLVDPGQIALPFEATDEESIEQEEIL